MTVAAKWAVRRFEIFLRTLSPSLPLLAGLFFWHRAWVDWHFHGHILVFRGRRWPSSPHRKHQNVGELASGIRPTIDNGSCLIRFPSVWPGHVQTGRCKKMDESGRTELTLKEPRLSICRLQVFL